MEKIAFQLAWLGEHKVLIFLFFAELLVAACLLIVFFPSASVLAQIKF